MQERGERRVSVSGLGASDPAHVQHDSLCRAAARCRHDRGDGRGSTPRGIRVDMRCATQRLPRAKPCPAAVTWRNSPGYGIFSALISARLAAEVAAATSR